VPKSDGSPPATKADIDLLMGTLAKLYDANERWKDELKEHFDLKIEIMQSELAGAKHDRIENHEDRILRLEEHVAAA